MSFATILSRATERILAQSGEGALLRGDTTVKAHIARDIEVADREGNVGYAEYVVTLLKSTTPARGDTLVQGSESFVLELPLDDNGYTVRYILRKTA